MHRNGQGVALIQQPADSSVNKSSLALGVVQLRSGHLPPNVLLWTQQPLQPASVVQTSTTQQCMPNPINCFCKVDTLHD